MAIVESARLIRVDPNQNNNKFFNIDLYEDGQVYTNWGRVGTNGQSKTYYGGKSVYDSKLAQKRKKYKDCKLVEGNTSESVNSELGEIAKSQIKTKSELEERLIDRLVVANVHQITRNTQISYNKDSGLFQTPLGIVTLEGINEARGILDDIFDIKDKSSRKFYNLSGEFLNIIPQKVGRDVSTFIDKHFSEDDGIRKQKDLLDSLESSYHALGKSKDTDTEEEKKEHESVFDASITQLEDDGEYKRISDYFFESKRNMHNYGNIKVANIFNVALGEMDKNFDSGNWGNIKEYYHGTSIANCLSILKSGLSIAPPSTARIAGKMFGNGIYGADSSSKSLGYSLGRWGQGSSNDGAWLFVCEFAMGKTHEPRGTVKSPPKGYDSVSALSRNTSLFNNEFIVYNNHQVRLKYLIECSTN